MYRSKFRTIKYMKGSFFSKAKYMNGVDFEILARTPVPQLPPSYPHPERILTTTTYTIKTSITRTLMARPMASSSSFLIPGKFYRYPKKANIYG